MELGHQDTKALTTSRLNTEPERQVKFSTQQRLRSDAECPRQGWSLQRKVSTLRSKMPYWSLFHPVNGVEGKDCKKIALIVLHKIVGTAENVLESTQKLIRPPKRNNQNKESPGKAK